MSSDIPPANYTPGLAWLFLSPFGRLGRHAYWLGFGFIWMVIAIAIRLWWVSLDGNVNLETLDLASFMNSNPLLPYLFFILQWLELAFVIKRCQDSGITGFAALLVFVPLVNLLAVVIFGFMPSTNGPNRYGPAPNSYYRSPKA
ncbi:putative membrane protein [Roseibium sp. TrichSKD4]|uniref:DUF805 domain-containing protein n=1 Tax=Roseibium sp. TrichSKD4 TaxID=744980 RepID=UPI0001E56C0E|nr:DUF805 domain-containing protein [Roseibium sp. TrichSKD4]EFO33176.1 putative membrane protein [Roseibium sp. TrichSKD4]